MKALYIGILTNGTTSRIRADTLQRLCGSAAWELIDTDNGFQDTGRIWKSAAFRLKAGSLVRKINQDIILQTKGQHYDLIWVDKGVYLWRNTVDDLRKIAQTMVHFTPDTAFFANRSRHFYAAASKYDLLVTTKSFELQNYYEIAESSKVLLATQAFDASLHRPRENHLERTLAAVFIGLCEPDREHCIEALLSEGVPVRVGGRGWKRFIRRHRGSQRLHFIGQAVFGEDYAAEYTSSSVGLGLLSKRFPELHTTRTFEIPACGAMLVTERNAETSRFFKEDEVLFFKDYRDAAIKIKKLLEQAEKIAEISRKGQQRVLTGGYDYASVLSRILNHLAITN